MRSDSRSVLLADIAGSKEEQDAYTVMNVAGFGRLRKFQKFAYHLVSGRTPMIRRPNYRHDGHDGPYLTQTFQLASCAWRCWFCYVDEDLRKASPEFGTYVSTRQMVQAALDARPQLSDIDLSGGQPELVPEWGLWMLQEYDALGLRGEWGLWVEDSLSNDILETFLSVDEIAYLANYPRHGLACCLKGFDPVSFAYNTGVVGSQFAAQLRRLRTRVEMGFDVFVNVMLTGPANSAVASGVEDLFRALRQIDPLLPLRTIPLEIKLATAAVSRLENDPQIALAVQYDAAEKWENLLLNKYGRDMCELPHNQIPLRTKP